jgi:3-dehydro-L-gulonate 2-dehydrogenase
MSNDSAFIHVPYQQMYDTFHSILGKHGFTPDNAARCAEIFSINSAEGIYTHGVNRFARFISYIKDGYIKVDQVPSRKGGFGAIEQWDGNLGPGPLNAIYAADQAMALATQHGIGCIALSNTNHWMRGGYYGWHTARKGFIFIGWTNTLANMPAWGATDSKLGNNPLVIAVPYKNEAIVLDTAMSQYSYGALDLYRLKNQKLPVYGGYDVDGNITQDADKILASRRVLPIGYWKGSGLSLLLDILATILSGGLSTHEISKREAEHALSQVYIAIDVAKLSHFPAIANSLDQIILDYHTSISEDGKDVRYPGEHIAQIREANIKSGIPVAKKIWDEIVGLDASNL